MQENQAVVNELKQIRSEIEAKKKQYSQIAKKALKAKFQELIEPVIAMGTKNMTGSYSLGVDYNDDGEREFNISVYIEMSHDDKYFSAEARKGLTVSNVFYAMSFDRNGYLSKDGPAELLTIADQAMDVCNKMQNMVSEMGLLEITDESIDDLRIHFEQKK